MVVQCHPFLLRMGWAGGEGRGEGAQISPKGLFSAPLPPPALPRVYEDEFPLKTRKGASFVFAIQTSKARDHLQEAVADTKKITHSSLHGKFWFAPPL